MNRDPAFLDELIEQGEQRTADFVTALGFEQAWLAGDSMRSSATSPTARRCARRRRSFSADPPAVCARPASSSPTLLAAAVQRRPDPQAAGRRPRALAGPQTGG